MFDFQQPYDRKNVIAFLQNTLLPEDFDLNKPEEVILPEFTPQHAKKITLLGKVSSLKLAVYEIRHDSENDPRVGLSREAFRLLGQFGQSCALILFTSKSSPNYRLSLVTVDLKEKAAKGTRREYSNPRRYSFFLGPDCKPHTPSEYLIKKNRVKDFDDLKGRFSIEVVTKEFYKEYAKVFSDIETIIGKHNKLSPENLRLFTQTLMNRLMFLRFLEKKKWVQFGDNNDYLANLYSAGGLKGQSFYKSRLCPLFFEALAIEGRQNSDIVGKAVFLNGGLFEKTELDNQISDIPDRAFKGLLGQDAGEEGLFYKYNFTVEESTSIDIEVAVDPEMLGKVFEELVTGRHESGSYYTPRPIVSFMCREALKGYLGAKTSTPKKAIESLVDDHVIAEDLTNKHAEEILFYLETLKAIDPACGSGAYLLGLLQELIEIRKVLQNQNLKVDTDFIYKIKLRLISHCLYGVDIDPFATNIAKLRLWLSLAVDTESPQPLPNLDFKIETGDSILGPCDPLADREDALVMSALRERAKKLVLKKDQFMLAHGQEKAKLYDEIKAEETAIAEETSTVVGKGVIVWHIHFAEVFASGRKTESTMEGQFGFMADAHKQKAFKITHYEPGGFDIVLANPPYIRQELIKGLKPRLKEVYPKTYMGTADVYTYFYARAVEMLAPDGMLVFISSNKWFRANYGKKLRKYIAVNCRVRSITDFKDSPIFESATAYPMIFVAQKLTKDMKTIFTEIYVPSSDGLNVLDIIRKFGRTLALTCIKNQEWTFADDNVVTIIEKMKASGVPLSEYLDCDILGGIKTGFNKAYLIDTATRQLLIDQDPACKSILKPVITGKDIRRWSLNYEGKWLIFARNNGETSQYSSVMKYLKKYQSKLQARTDQGKYWWELRPCAYYQEFQKEKIVFPDISPEPRFTLDSHAYFPEMTAFIIPCKDMFLLGVLNSKPVLKFYLDITAQIRGGYLRYKRQYVKQIPIPNASVKEKIAIEKLVQKCLDAKGENCEQWEKEIDERVANLYGLTADEIAIVENSVK